VKIDCIAGPAHRLGADLPRGRRVHLGVCASLRLEEGPGACGRAAIACEKLRRCLQARER